MQTSCDWSIHDVSARAAFDDERTAELICKNIDLVAAAKAVIKGLSGCRESAGDDAILDALIAAIAQCEQPLSTQPPLDVI
jgi:hypothetical protein